MQEQIWNQKYIYSHIDSLSLSLPASLSLRLSLPLSLTHTITHLCSTPNTYANVNSTQVNKL